MNNNIEELARKMAEEMLAEMLKKQTGNNSLVELKTVEKINITDSKLQERVELFFNRLEKFFPEHKVFALDSIDKDLRERLSNLYKLIGYKTADDFLNAYGYEIISGNAVKELRSFVMYTPGNEPEIIKSKVENMCNSLSEYYPDKIISRGMQNDHKNLSKRVSGLYQWLGYRSASEMLEAYGYKYMVDDVGGRPKGDYEEIVNMLIEKYKNNPKPTSMGALIFDNPEYKGNIKTLQNKSQELFGMTISNYFKQIGILGDNSVSNAYKQSFGVSKSNDDKFREIFEQLNSSKYSSFEEYKKCFDCFFVRVLNGEINICGFDNSCLDVVIPDGVSKLSKGLFLENTDIKSVFIPSSVKEISAEAFSGCSNLLDVVISDGVEIISKKAFYDCSSLKVIEIPSSVISIEALAFGGCNSLMEVNFTNKYIDISDSAFNGCGIKVSFDNYGYSYNGFKYKLNKNRNIVITSYEGNDEKIEIPEYIDGIMVTEIDSGAFKDMNFISELIMPDTITSIGSSVFENCISLKKLHLSNGVSKLMSNVFNGCTALEEINIPDLVTELKVNTFAKSPIRKLHIGKSLQKIDIRSFYSSVTNEMGKIVSSRSVLDIDIDPMNEYLKVDGTMILSSDGKTLLACLGCNGLCEIPMGVEVINENAFIKLHTLTDIKFSDTVKYISKKAFNQTNLRSVTFNDNIIEIGEAAFDNCNRLTSVVFNEGLEIIGDKCFETCPIVSVIIPSTVKYIGKYAFSCFSYYGNNKFKNFVVSKDNPYYYFDGFGLYELNDGNKCLSLVINKDIKKYVVSEGTTEIGKYVFSNRYELNEIILPAGLITISESSFEGCHINSIDLPDTLKFIGNKAFKGTSIKKLVIPSSVEKIGYSAFSIGNNWDNNRASIRSIKVSKGNTKFFTEKNTLYEINEDGSKNLVFYCGDESKFVIPDDVVEIYPEAFYKSIVSEIQIPSTIKKINDHSFVGCFKLRRLYLNYSRNNSEISDAVIYIPEVDKNMYQYDALNVCNEFLDCIRVDGKGNIFDFVKYDSLFDTISSTKDRILIATDRLKSAIQLIPVYRDNYLKYLRKKAKEAVKVVIEYDDLAGLNILAELNVFVGDNIDEVIELANKAEKPEILSYLLNYKNSNIGINESDYEL